MCGIFGQIDGKGIRDAENKSRQLFADLKHRGPNDRGIAYFDAQANEAAAEQEPSLMLGQVRLSIIDLSTAGHQPMFSADGRYCLVYNGEIYNFQDLRKELEPKGYQFKSNSDTEVLLYWLAEYGETRLTALNGMFAFAFYDRKENTILCVRDYFGIKPFYYSFENGRFSFASELPALLDLGVSRELNKQSVYQYLVWGQYDCGDTTFYETARALKPGHYFKLDLHHLSAPDVKCYWKPDLTQKIEVSFDEAAQHVRELFLKQIEQHLISDVPLGVALSGGIDSSAIACAVRYLYPDRELHTFSYVADDAALSEESHIRVVEEAIHPVAHHTGISIETLRSRLPELIRAQGEPFGSTSNFAQFKVFECARENGITVTLEGQGADEIFGGYTGYPDECMRSYYHHCRLGKLRQFLKSAPAIGGRSSKSLLKSLIAAELPFGLGAKLRTLLKRDTREILQDVFTPEFMEGVSPHLHNVRDAVYPCVRHEYLHQCLAYQVTEDGLTHLLRHGDRSSMNFSIESRVPFLTREMAEYCLALPEKYLVTEDCLTKAVFRKAMRGIVPDAILDRRDKIGFATPERKMFLEDPVWVETQLMKGFEIPYLNADGMLQFWHEIQSGRRKFDWTVWRCINFIAFASETR